MGRAERKVANTMLVLAMLLLAGCGASTASAPVRVETPGRPAQTMAVPTTESTSSPSTLQFAIQLADQVSVERLMDDVRWLADDERRGRLTGSPEEDEVGAWLVQRLQSLGLQPFTAAGLNGYELPFEAPAATRYGRVTQADVAAGENIIAVLPGASRPDSYVYIGAHYDHLGVSADGQVYNGADDDATGVAAVLEAARILSAARVRPQETLVFVAFSGEEIGLLGSAALCEQLSATGLIDRSLLLNMEVLGAKQGTGTYLDVWDEESAVTENLVKAVQLAGDQLDVRVKRQGLDPGSDAQRLLRCGVPAISVDVAWSSENHPHIHAPSDDPEYIDVDGFQDAVRVAVAALWLLANDGH